MARKKLRFTPEQAAQLLTSDKLRTALLAYIAELSPDLAAEFMLCATIQPQFVNLSESNSIHAFTVPFPGKRCSISLILIEFTADPGNYNTVIEFRHTLPVISMFPDLVAALPPPNNPIQPKFLIKHTALDKASQSLVALLLAIRKYDL